MASTKIEADGSDLQLKHLGFVRILTINAVVLVSNIYDSAKQSSGSLKSTIGTVENAVRAVIGPVYERFNVLPSDFLVFLDKKVDEATYKFDECAPPAAKNAVSKAQVVFKKGSKVAQELLEEAKVAGPFAAITHAGTMTKSVAVSQLAEVWYKIDKYPALHGLSEMALPTAAHWSEKYNSLVKDLSAKGYNIFSYAPLVPVEELAKAYKAAASKKTDGGSSSSESESDKE